MFLTIIGAIPGRLTLTGIVITIPIILMALFCRAIPALQLASPGYLT